MADGAACFRQDSSGPALLRILLRVACLPVRAFHPLRTAFPNRSRSQASTISESYNPGRAVTLPVWALPRSLATTCGIIVIFSSCGYLDVSVPRVCPLLRRVTTSLWPGCPIRKSPDQRLFAPPRSLSQLITSFFASESQGIPHALLVTFSNFLLVFFFSLQTSHPCGHGLACQAFFFQYVNELVFPFGNWWLSRKRILNNLYKNKNE